MPRALLADGDRARLDLVATVLTRDGLEVITASGLEQAVARLEGAEPVLAVIAEDLPGGGVLELAARVRGAGGRVALLAAEDGDGLAARGCDAALRSPFRHDELREHLVAWGLVAARTPPAAGPAPFSYRVPLPEVFALEMPPPPAPPAGVATVHATPSIRAPSAAGPVLPLPLPVPATVAAAPIEELPELDLDIIATSEPVATPPATAASGLRLPLEGDLGLLPVPRLLFELYVATFTGALWLTRSAVSRLIYLRGGLPVRVDSHRRDETLGRLLIEHGRITEEQQQRSFELMQRSGCRQGEALQQLGLLRDGELRDVLRDQTARKLTNSFAWRDGAYRIEAREDFEDDAELSGLHPLLMIWRGVREHYDDESLLAYFAELRGRFAVTTELFRVHYDALGPLLRELSLPEQLDGATTFDALLAREARLPGLLQALYVLLVTELVVASPQPGTAATTRSPARSPPPTTPASVPRAAPVPGTPPVPDAAGVAARPLVRASRLDPAAMARLVEEIAAEHARLAQADFFDALRVDTTSSTEEVDAAYANIAATLYLDDLPPELPAQTAARARKLRETLARAHRVLRDPDLRDRHLAEQASRFAGAASQPQQEKAEPEAVGPQAPPELDLADDRRASIAAEYAHTAGRALLQAGRFEEAARKFSEAIRAVDREPTYRVALGKAILGNDPNSETARMQAVTCLQQALQLDPSHVEANLEMAKLLRASGNVERACAYVQRVLQRAPENQEARWLLASLG